MIRKQLQALFKPYLHWKPYGYSIHGNARFRDETRHVRLFHYAWDWLEKFLAFRVACVVAGSMALTVAIFAILYWITTHVRVAIV